MVDWHTKTDYLRSNPAFNGRPRYDFILLNRGRVWNCAQLVFMFVCRVGGDLYQLALVQTLEKYNRPATRTVDKKLSISRWHIRNRDRCEVIPLSCIVRGAVFVADAKHSGDYFLLDTLDEDMFLRAKSVS